LAATRPEGRATRAKLAALSLHAQGKTNTAPARKAANDRFDREVDPDGLLDPIERARRAEFARRAHFIRMALESAKVRRAKASGR
jgi:hypothetical protein